MKRKTIVLFMAMAALFALPTTTLAQNWDGGLFGTEESENYFTGLMNRAGDPVDISGDISNYGIGEVPLGSGVVIMLLAGAGYVALKKKED